MRSQTRVLLWALAVAFLLNSAGLFWLSNRLTDAFETVRWVIPQISAQAASRVATQGGARGPGTDADVFVANLYYDPFCAACRASLPALDTITKEFPNVIWRVHALTSAPQGDGPGRLAALMIVCDSRDGPAWPLMWQLAQLKPEEVVAYWRNAPFDLKRCTREQEATDEFWTATFTAAARGVRSTPTLELGGVRVEGLLRTSALRQLITSTTGRSPL